MKYLSHLVFLLVAAASLALLFGPRVAFDDAAAAPVPPEIGALDAWLAAREAAVPGLRPGAAKQIVWADPASPAPTPVSIVYLHGFSASKAEIRPTPDRVAAALGANLHFARLTGHGRDGAAMAQARVGDWFADVAEAIAVGRRIGGKVLVIATSTGGTMAALAALRPELSRDVAGIAFVSPNFGLQAGGSSLLTLPFAPQVLPAILGPRISSEPLSPEHAAGWTLSYPIAALFPMAAAVKAAAAADYSGVKIPALFVFSDDDKVVNPAATRAVADRWGGPTAVVPVTLGPGDDPNAHVIAGDIRSPGMTDAVARRIAGWAKGVTGS